MRSAFDESMAYGSLHGNVLHVFFPWGLLPPGLNDFKRAFKWAKGWLRHSMMQLCHAFNVNYGPFPRGGNTAKKQDIHMEWRALKPSRQHGHRFRGQREFRRHFDIFATFGHPERNLYASTLNSPLSFHVFRSYTE